jgi:hypothetical protein
MPRLARVTRMVVFAIATTPKQTPRHPDWALPGRSVRTVSGVEYRHGDSRSDRACVGRGQRRVPRPDQAVPARAEGALLPVLGSIQDAEDALQDTLLTAWRSLGGFEGRTSIRTWLYRIATTRCLNALRSASLRPAKAWDIPGVEPPEPSALGEVAWLEPFPDALLAGAIAVPPGPEARYEQREAISLAFITAPAIGSPPSLASRTACSPGSICRRRSMIKRSASARRNSRGRVGRQITNAGPSHLESQTSIACETLVNQQMTDAIATG